jgi:hypothetical protein
MTQVSSKSRLEPHPVCYPWVQATNLHDCFLFWLPVTGFPLRHDERVWILEFLQRLSSGLKTQHTLREEVFLQFSTATQNYEKSFRKYAERSFHLPGVSRKPEEDLRGIPDAATIEEEMKETKKFDLEKWTSDYAIWFQKKEAEKQRSLFLGEGGVTLLFMPPDPKTKPPILPFTPKFRAAFPVLQARDVDGMLESAFSLNDDFLAKSKILFGQGMNPDISLETIGFVLPLFDSGHLLKATPEEREQWFGLFDVYFRESTADHGCVLAFRNNYTTLMQDVLDAMRGEGKEYPVQVRVNAEEHA